MVLRFLFRYFANEQVIQRMADSYPMRRAAQLVVSAMYRTKGIIEQRGLTEDQIKKLKGIVENLERNVKESKTPTKK